MSSAAAATAVEAPPPAKGKKKLILIIAIAAVLVLALAGGAALLLLKKAPAEDDAEAGAAAHTEAVDDEAVPTFVALDSFTVNLADRDAERYAQVGITLEIDEPKLADRVKTFMPAIRNNILLAIADRTAGDLLERGGKAQLAERIAREASRALGYDVPAEADAETAEAAPRKKRRDAELPIRAVHFSNFIIQ